MKKRLISLALSFALTLSLATTASAAMAWRLTGDTLVFSGNDSTGFTTGSTKYAMDMWKKGTAGRATGLELQEGITDIHDSGFSGMAQLTWVKMADTVTKIGRHAFINCTKLSEVQIPAKLTFLGEYAFKNCTALERIVLPRTLKEVEQGVFYGCSKLKEIELGSDVYYMGRQAFMGCTKLSVFAVPEKVKRIHSEIFSQCTGLVQVYLPAGLERVDAGSFDGCVSLTDIYYGGTKAQWQKVVKEDATLNSSAVTVHYNAKAADLDRNVQGTGHAGLFFDDVLPDYWGYNPVMTCARNGLVMGIRQPDANGIGSFGPDRTATLGQLLVVVTTLVCPEKRPNLPGHWARGSYAAALETGIIQPGDFENTDAALDSSISRQDMAYIAANAARYKGWKLEERAEVAQELRDFHVVSPDRQQAVLQCCSSGILAGYGDKTFGPKNNMTRAQMTVVICRLAGW